jgi:hypothetical protein
METQGVKVIRRNKGQQEASRAASTEAANLARYELRNTLRSRAEKLAGDRICVMNWKFPDADETFPNHPWLRCIRKYFRDAIGGPLAIDEPQLPHEVKRCEERAAVIHKIAKKHGFRYVMIHPDKTEADDILELQKCGL